MKNLLKRLWQEEEAQDLVEYGLLLVHVSLGMVAAIGTLAFATSNAFGNVSDALSASWWSLPSLSSLPVSSS